MRLVIVDVEADGPFCGTGPGYSMASFAAIPVGRDLTVCPTFHSGMLRPISPEWVPEAVGVHGVSHARRMAEGGDPESAMKDFAEFLGRAAGDRITFLSDNPAFDWQFINWYFHRFLGRNPFGFSARRIGDLWSGFKNDLRVASDWKKFRKRKHSHNPADDVYGNAEALVEMDRLGLCIFGGSETVPPKG